MKTRRKLSQTPALKSQQRQILIYASAGFVLATIVGAIIFFYMSFGSNKESKAATPDFYSINTGYWTDNGTWNGGIAPAVSDINSNIEVFEFVTRAGDLSYKSGSNKTLIISDTLYVVGNLTMGNKTQVEVKDGGVLIVTSNFTADNKIVVGNGGVIAIGGDMIFPTNNQDQYNGGNGELFVLGNVIGNNDASNSAQGANSLSQTYPRIYDILENGITTLPIVLVSFTASNTSEGIEINWVSAQEINNDFYSIERSQYGKQFVQIATVKGAGNSNEELAYTYIDQNPLEGTSFYRLKQTDYDGQYEYFKIISTFVDPTLMEKEDLHMVSVYPNPFQRDINITVYSPYRDYINIQIMSLEGLIIESHEMFVEKGVQSVILQTINELSPGVYVLQVRNGMNQIDSKRILKR